MVGIGALALQALVAGSYSTRQVFEDHQRADEPLEDDQAGGCRDEPDDKRPAATEGEPADRHRDNQ
jgi:hypothetical protein